ncbi:hypothetical protein HYW82_00700 [Candidatus Peregrinibacteria bacterium]|nr:hypothetical protein [Candidatus Peregrinibacteria bacterium]
MKTGSKVLVAVLVVAAVVGGAVYFGGGENGQGFFQRFPKVPRVSKACVSGTLVYDSDSYDGIYDSFTDFAYAVEDGTLNDCQYHFQGGIHFVDSFLAQCSKSDLLSFIDESPTISCYKQVGSDFFRFDLYEDKAAVTFGMDVMDSDTFKISTFKAYEPYSVHVN